MEKATKSITLATLAAVSLTMAAACSNEKTTTADCVMKQPNGQYKKADDNQCDRNGGSRGAYVWYYGGTTTSDGRVRGGTLQRPSTGGISTRSGTTIRGGFGGHGGGGS
jgi:hypothetical protein